MSCSCIPYGRNTAQQGVDTLHVNREETAQPADGADRLIGRTNQARFGIMIDLFLR